MKTVAIIPAGGTGRRMGEGIPKQYLPLAGIPILVHTLKRFRDRRSSMKSFSPFPKGMSRRSGGRSSKDTTFPRSSLVLAGGRERQDSVRNALMHVRDEHEIILVHDGVRPFVTGELIGRAVAAAREFGAVTVGVPVRDTVKEVTAEGWVEKTVTTGRALADADAAGLSAGDDPRRL